MSLRVLIVDDDPDFLAIAQSSLEAEGFIVERAPGGLRGVFLGTQRPPDVILCDLRMPGIDGFVVAEALRSEPATAKTAIFACTGRPELSVRAEARPLAFDGVLVKPVDWSQAAEVLREAVRARAG
jgi:CheY-like chemotaxis protein